MRTPVTPKTIRRLLAADGYLHLDLPHRAVDELQKTGAAGPLEGPRQLLMGVAFKRSGESDSAIECLEKAARIIPSPVRRFAWSELVDCYRSAGSHELADLAETLGGGQSYSLRIALPFGEISLESTEPIAETV